MSAVCPLELQLWCSGKPVCHRMLYQGKGSVFSVKCETDICTCFLFCYVVEATVSAHEYAVDQVFTQHRQVLDAILLP